MDENEYEDMNDWHPSFNNTPPHQVKDDTPVYSTIVKKPSPTLSYPTLPPKIRHLIARTKSLTGEPISVPLSRNRTSSLSACHTNKCAAPLEKAPPPPPTIPLPEVPTDDSNDMPQKMCQVISDPYSLETFCEKFEFPQLVRVCTGYRGATDDLTMSEGEELVLFFVKTSKVVKASSERGSEFYHIPLNSSLQFAPHYYNSTELTQRYETVDNILKSFKKNELPKVMRVCKSFKGKSDESSVQAGELIFPEKVSTKKFKTVLKCLSNTGKGKKKLELSCAGDFSINPGDVKMYLEDFVHFIKGLPISVKVFNDKVFDNQVTSEKSFCIDTGTVLTLEEPKPLKSYVCTTDVFGRMDYPLMDLPMSMPIEVECIRHEDLDMSAIFNKTQDTYENFTPSLIQKSMFSSQSTREFIAQQELYDHVLKDDSTLHIHSLAKPSIIYEQIPAQLTVVEKDDDTDYLSLHAVVPLPSSDETFYENHNFGLNPLYESFTSATEVTTSTNTHACSVSDSTLLSPLQSPSIERSTSFHSNASEISSNPEENISYLRLYTLADMFKLLENMNLEEHKKSFGEHQIDGEIFVCLEKSDLEDLGVTTGVNQKRLMKLIDGTVSAKKYEGGAYEKLKAMQTKA